MGLLDSVLGGVLGQKNPEAGEGGGINPKIMMALGLLAMLAMRNRGQQGDGATPVGGDAAAPGAPGDSGGLGGLGGILGGLTGGSGGLDLGGLLGGLLSGREGAAGSAQAMGAAAGGIGILQQLLAQGGLGEQVNSWIGTGSNEPVSPQALTNALGGTGAIESLADSTGLSRDDVAAQLSEGLPELIDQLTPQGSLPPQ